MRVVSLLPSATELLCAVGPGAPGLLVGRSHECDYPASLHALPVLTGARITAASSAGIDAQVRGVLSDRDDDGGPSASESLYTLDMALLERLKPDVILTQDLCEVCSIDLGTVRAVAQTMRPQPKVVCLNPVSIDDVFDDLRRVGEAVGLSQQANRAADALRERYTSARHHVRARAAAPEVAFLEWMDPLYAGGHWTPQLIEAAGGRHSLNPAGAKSREIAADELVDARPQRLVICPCGYDLSDIRRELDVLTSKPWWHELPAVRKQQVVMVDGNQMFNRPGPRLVDAFCWLVGWINECPEIIPPEFPVEPVR